MTFGIRKPIDIISHSTGTHHTSIRTHERELHNLGQDIMTETHYKRLRERILDEQHSKPRDRPIHNHVDIDFRTGKTTTSYKDHE